jgi:hypothetical protein
MGIVFMMREYMNGGCFPFLIYTNCTQFYLKWPHPHKLDLFDNLDTTYKIACIVYNIVGEKYNLPFA